MHRTIRNAPGKSFRALASSLAMAIALAGGGVAGSALIAAPAQAQSLSKDFRAAAAPMSTILTAEGGDANAAKAMIPAMIAAVKNDDDRMEGGNLILITGNKLSEKALQRQGLEMMLASGKVEPERLGLFNYFVGSIAYEAGDYAAARTALNNAVAAGYNENDPIGLIADTYFRENNTQGGVDYLLGKAAEMKAAGGQAPELWLLTALQKAYDHDLSAGALAASTVLLKDYPTNHNWQVSLQITAALNEYQDQPLLDLLRLMRLTETMTTRDEYVRYIEAADPRIMANEVGAVLQKGLDAGVFQASGDNYYTEVKSVVQARAAQNRTSATSLVREANASSDAMISVEAGDVLLSIDDYAQAETMYQQAVTKGIADPNTALTRLGITQVHQGKLAEAQATFAKVTGARAPLAKMWGIYAAQMAG